MSLERVLQAIDDDLDGAIDRLVSLLKIPSISTDPAFHSDCEAAAAWLVRDLEASVSPRRRGKLPANPWSWGISARTDRI